MTMANRIFRHRQPLQKLRESLVQGQINIGVLGGSISAPVQHNWPEPMIAWLMEQYPHVHLTIENAAVGSTGSQYALFRVQKDILERDCDLVFLEYAVNDSSVDTETRMRTREGLIRKIRAGSQADIVIVYTYNQNMYDDMIANRMPPTIQEFEQIAEHYNISSVWMGLHALGEVKRGHMTWAQWLPDGLHPQERGSWSYAQAVIEFLQAELIETALPSGKDTQKLPDPLNIAHWQNSTTLPFTEINLSGPWQVRRRRDLASVSQELFTSAPGAKLSFQYEGRVLAVASLFGKKAAEFRYRLDNKDWMYADRDRSGWCPDNGYPRIDLLENELDFGKHKLELEVIHGNGPNCISTEFHLLFIGIVS